MKKAIIIMSLIVCIFGMTKYSEASTMIASWYQCCKRTANGEKFNPNGMTAAHKTLPFGTRLRLSYNGKTIVVRINDRGPFVKGRHLDLARGAARKLGCSGVCKIIVERIS